MRNFLHRIAIAIIVLIAYGALGAAPAMSTTDDDPACSKCWDDFDEPPPTHGYCSVFGYYPTCWTCSGWEHECLGGECEYLIVSYWEDEWCGYQCRPEAQSCNNAPRYLDGTTFALSNGSTTDLPDGVIAEHDRNRGAITYRHTCDGTIANRLYDAMTTQRITTALAELTL